MNGISDQIQIVPTASVATSLDAAARFLAEHTTVCCIGVFDGVHIGHQRLIRAAVDEGRDCGLPSVVLTFANHPLSVLAPAYAPLLLSDIEEKIKHLAELQPTLIVSLEFTRELADLEPDVFLHRVLVHQLRARSVWCGGDFRFGRGGRGDLILLAELGASFGIAAHTVEPVCLEGRIVSSTWIRSLIERGEVAQAAECLGRNPVVRGVVVKGHGRGRQLGYPTANVAPPAGIVVPGNGIYAIRAVVGNRRWDGVMHLGPLPTFGVVERRFEVFLFDFSGDLLGETMAVECVGWLRAVRQFESPEALAAQIRADVEAARVLLAEKPHGR